MNPMYELCLGRESWPSLIGRIVERACACTPGLEPAPCRELVELTFVVRIRKTEACGRHAACRPDVAVWGEADARAGETSGWIDGDVLALPDMFAAAAADLAGVVPDGRGAVEARLADAFRDVMSEVVFYNRRCGTAEVCGAEAVFPIAAVIQRTDQDPLKRIRFPDQASASRSRSKPHRAKG